MPKPKSRRTILQRIADRPGGAPIGSIFDPPPRTARRPRVVRSAASVPVEPGSRGPVSIDSEFLAGAEGIALGLKGFLRGQAPGIRRVSGFGLVKDFLNAEDLAKLSAVTGIPVKTLGNKPSRFMQDHPGEVTEALGQSRALTMMLVPGMIGAISPLGGKLAAVKAVKGIDTLRAIVTKGPKAWLANFRKISPARQAVTAKQLAKEAAKLEPAAARLATRAAVGGKAGVKMAADAKVLRDTATRVKATVSKTKQLTAQAPKAAVAAKAVRATTPSGPTPPASAKLGTLAGARAKNVAQTALTGGRAAVTAGKGLGPGGGGFASKALRALKKSPKVSAVMTLLLADQLDQVITTGFLDRPAGGAGFIGRARQLGRFFGTARTRGTKETPEEVQARVNALKMIEAQDVTSARFQQNVRTGVLKRDLVTVHESEAEKDLLVSLQGERQKAIDRLERRLMKFKQAHPDVPTSVAMRVLTKRPPSLSEIINPPDSDTEAELSLYDALSQSIMAGPSPAGGEATPVLSRPLASAPGVGVTGEPE